MFVGGMMIPDPIMFTATMNVSWSRFIFLVDVLPSMKFLRNLISAFSHERHRCGT
jgi:hypothetical protein